MFKRLLKPLKTNSFFLFGARSTGKTTFLSTTFQNESVHRLDLLDPEVIGLLQGHPEAFSGIVQQNSAEWTIVDEIQKVPELLDQIHLLIEKHSRKFVLPGSSARKLKRGGADLLAGRAFVLNMFPLTHLELGEQFNMDEVLSFGSLPKIFSFQTLREKVLFLRAYTETYLKEEILIEQLIRNLPPFRRFLEISARQDTEIVSYSNIGRDILVDPKIVSNYYTILQDTLLGFLLEPFHTSLRKRQKKAPKFYWFDLGVRRALAGTLDQPTQPKSYEYGSLFESFVVNEIHRLLSYSERSFKLSFLRIDDNSEIDLIVERTGFPTLLIEIKSSNRVHEDSGKAIRHWSREISNSIPIVLSCDPIARKVDGVSFLPWKRGFEEFGIYSPL